MSALLLFLFLICLPTIVRAGRFALTAAIMGRGCARDVARAWRDGSVPGDPWADRSRR